MKKIERYTLIKSILLFVSAVSCFYVSFAFAQSDLTLGSIAGNVQASFSNIAKLITAGSFIAGLGFAIGAILKFKAHKDNAQAVPLGTPIALLFIAAAMLFLPSVFKAAGMTIFGTTPTEAGVSGTTSI
ncbi:MAG: type IV secretion protein IcmD [Pseudomonadota bacterium]|nr:type IV secretion protein IcmD [Gammaproteobacteria bacterium]MBU1558447.1 type IV secretion protein IcmD [Gammaproteobacteria bacterium]MBU1628956.1 type IV secretion protein IcmD [Gammaproteobacteria bacterium]MBU1926655.1 type IV secretion protein IcmD [Gammaproteobacteria bacterium]MBU2546548.1 type IV secretion protein IcmD [Gammaproteobacteria bacterium]